MTGPDIINLGCRLNLAEGETIRTLLGARDTIVVNSCAVTNEAVAQARQSIRKLKRERPSARIVVTGCAAQTQPAMFAEMAEVDRVLGNDDKMHGEAWRATRDALAADALSRGPIAGLSIAVQAKGREVLARGYGYADAEAQVRATADTSYPIASVSKRLTAGAILRLVDQGRLTLDDPLSRFFPSARPAIGALTIRNLLQHTSGFTKGGPAPKRAAETKD